MAIASTNKNIAVNMTADDIVNRGLWKAAEKYTNNEHCELVMKIGHSGLLFKELDKNQIKNVFQYAIQLTGEPFALMYWILASALNNGQKSNFFNMMDLRDENGIGIIVALKYLSVYDSKDKNDTFLRRAQRSVGVKFKPARFYNHLASQYFQDIDNSAECQQAAV
jgi:hypothetical protein